jgi:hypothetical protein
VKSWSSPAPASRAIETDLHETHSGRGRHSHHKRVGRGGRGETFARLALRLYAWDRGTGGQFVFVGEFVQREIQIIGR